MNKQEELYNISKEALARVINYMEEAEERNYDKSTWEEQENHIYRDVLVLDTLLRHTTQEDIKDFHATFGEEQTCAFTKYCKVC